MNELERNVSLASGTAREGAPTTSLYESGDSHSSRASSLLGLANPHELINPNVSMQPTVGRLGHVGKQRAQGLQASLETYVPDELWPS